MADVEVTGGAPSPAVPLAPKLPLYAPPPVPAPEKAEAVAAVAAAADPPALRAATAKADEADERDLLADVPSIDELLDEMGELLEGED
jgi:hypothetical protein